MSCGEDYIQQTIYLMLFLVKFMNYEIYAVYVSISTENVADRKVKDNLNSGIITHIVKY